MKYMINTLKLFVINRKGSHFCSTGRGENNYVISITDAKIDLHMITSMVVGLFINEH